MKLDYKSLFHVLTGIEKQDQPKSFWPIGKKEEELIEQGLDTLNFREKLIIISLHDKHEPISMKKLAQQENISSARVGQIRNTAYGKQRS